ncbi:MAG: carboxypeptidase-like regulatory domain-containing protein [Bacteroidia bacterium]|nr:carboxypeptidase-like regulatory domain-containing protein [Bacteroidia bacterium]
MKQNQFLKKLLIGTLVILCPFISMANEPGDGILSGRIIDKTTGETLIGVPVMLEGTTFGAVTDLDGYYKIEKIPAGKYSVVVRYIGYTSKIISEVEIKAKSVTTADVMMESSDLQLNEVTITADMKRESIGSILLLQKKSATVQDGISSEAIKKTADKNTGEVIRRVSGASIQEGRFVIIRGLNERYNSATLNGVPLASTEPDRKAFSFDLFPSSLLDNLIIVKTASPELQGEFAGGILQLNTKDIPDKGFFSFNAGVSTNSISTFKTYKDYQGGKTDWLGRDDGTRALPEEFPGSTELKKSTTASKIDYSKMLMNDWAIQEKSSAPMGQSYQLSFGQNKKVLKKDFGIIGALSYSSSQKKSEVERSDYDFDGSQNYNFADEQYKQNVFWGGLLNLTYKLNDHHKISLKNLYSVNAEDQTIVRNGTDIENQQYIEASALRYSSTQFYNSTLSGNHYLPGSGVKLNWYGSINKTAQSVPNLRRMYYYRNIDNSSEDTSMYAYVPFGNASPNYAGKFYSDLQETIYNAEFNFSFPLKFLGDDQSIKAGYAEQYKDRVFDARVMGYVVTNPGKFNWELLFEPIDAIFDTANMGSKGFRIDEITNPSDHYTGSSNLHSGFLQFENALGSKLKAVWGIRIENYIQKLNSFGYSNDTIQVKTNYLDILPSANLNYSLSEKSNLRFAVSKTVARPEFRELAPFSFYDFSTATSVVGNSNLKRTEIYNFDIRFETFPKNGQILSTSVFYKDFTNPIEPVVESSGAGSRKITFQNAPGAYVYGIEFEWRKNFDFVNSLVDWKQWENISFYGNIALMKSEVDKSDDLRATEDRPMQGQSPYLINAGLMYADGKSGLGFNMVYNRIGKRIYQVGNSGYLSIEESPRNLLDFQVSKRVFQNGEIKFTVSDILNEPGVFYQDQNDNGRYAADIDSGISTYNYGTNYSLSVSYKF